MQLRATIGSYAGRARRVYRELRMRVRSTRAAVALLVLLTLSLGEPLLCIIHCQLWLPIAYHSYFAAQHAHMHHTSAHVVSDGAGTASGAQLVSAPPATDASCFMLRAGSNDGVPFHLVPSPIHDMLPTLLVLLTLIWLLSARPAAPPGDPPRIAHSPRLRPPIPFAA